MRKKRFFLSGSVLFLLAVCVLPLPAQTNPGGRVLINDDFEGNNIGAKPVKWACHLDEENEISVVEAPAIGNRAVRLCNTGLTVWKPLISGFVSGESDAALQLDCEWYLTKPFSDDKSALTVTMRGKGNIGLVVVSIGGPGGIAVMQTGLGYVPLNLPVKFNQWNHLTIIIDPIVKGKEGKFTLIVKQGEEKAEFKNLSFYPPAQWQGDFPTEWWYTPTFNLFGAPSPDREVYIDNVRLEVIQP